VAERLVCHTSRMACGVWMKERRTSFHFCNKTVIENAS